MHSFLNHVRGSLAQTAGRGGTHFRRISFLMAALLLMATQFAAPTNSSLASASTHSTSAPINAASTSSGAGTPDIATLDFSGTGGGLALDVVIKGTIAYLFETNKLIIIDIQNPAAPKWLGEYRFETRPEGSFVHFDVAASHVYIPTAPNGLQIIDVSDPRQPNLCGWYTEMPYVWGIQIVDSTAYLAGEHFQILDVHDPCNPQLLGSDPKWASKVVVSGGLAYLGTQFNGITIMDVSNPSVLKPLGLYIRTFPGDGAAQVNDYTVIGDYLYIAESSGLQVIHVSRPDAPTLVGSYRAVGGALSIDVVGSRVYMSVSGKLAIIDVRDPSVPILLGSYAPLNESLGIQVSGSFAYIAAEGDDLQIIDVRNPASPQRYGNYITIKYPMRVLVEGTLAYIGGLRLDILDISELHNPKIIGSYQTPSGIGDMELVGGLAYIAGGMEFEIIDIHNPAQPTSVGHYSVPRDSVGFSSTITHVQVVGTQAYLSLKGDAADDEHRHGMNGLLVLDVSNPAVPQVVTSYTTTTPVRDLQVVGTRAYLALGHDNWVDFPSGLLILDVSKPELPTQIGMYRINGTINDLQVGDNLAYLVSEREGLNILDVSDPAHPRRIGLFTRTLGYPPITAVQVDGPVAYLMADDIEVLNVSDPTRPTLHSVFPARLWILDMQMVGDNLYTVNGEEMSVYHVERDQASADIAPSGGSLVNQIKTINMIIPPNAVDTTAVVSYTGFLAQTQPLTEDQRVVRSFAIDTGQQSDVQLADFAQPYTIELHYTQLQLSAALAQKSTLGVAVRDGDSWTELPPTSYTVDIANDRVILTSTQGHEYALVGRSAHTFLPMIGH